MNRELAHEIIGCLRISGSPRTHEERLLNFGLREWMQTLGWLDEAGLALVLWRRLQQLGVAGALPGQLAPIFARNLHDHRQRISEMVAEFETINRAFDAAGIEYAALKGFALIPEYCPVASLRTTYDYDYFVRPGCLKRACQALEGIDYHSQPDDVSNCLVWFHASRPPRSPRSRDDLYSCRFPRTVELHSQLWDPEELKIRLRLSADPLASRQLRRLGAVHLDADHSELRSDLSFWALCEEDELVFQLLHAFRHILQDWCRLASLFDVAGFLEHRFSDFGFWQRFLDRVQSSPPLEEIAGVVFLLSTRLFGAALPEAVAAATSDKLPNQVVLWLDRYGYESAVTNFSTNKFGLLLHREFVSDKSIWRTIERRRLFPLHRPNQAAKGSAPGLATRFAAGWKQGVYVARRLRHHLVGAAQYRFELSRWERMPTQGRRAGARPPT